MLFNSVAPKLRHYKKYIGIEKAEVEKKMSVKQKKMKRRKKKKELVMEISAGKITKSALTFALRVSSL